jgi:hypothetical protein
MLVGEYGFVVEVGGYEVEVVSRSEDVVGIIWVLVGRWAGFYRLLCCGL